MKKGDKIKCPHCGENSLLKEKKSFNDAFELCGCVLVCAFCGKEVKEQKSSEKAPGTQGKKSAADRLSQLLGGEEVTKVSIAADADDKRFCCYCAHYIKHPFMNRCGLTLKEIEATDRCENFKKKEAEEQTNL